MHGCHARVPCTGAMHGSASRTVARRNYSSPRGGGANDAAMTTAAPRASGDDHAVRPATLAALRASGWRSKPVKNELRDNLVRALAAGETLFPTIVGYDDTVIPEIVN